MNKLIIIGNLTADPVSNTTSNGKFVCNFTVAVNRRKQQNQEHPEADFFRCAVWNALGENCAKYLAKGRKVCVVGAVQVRMFQDKNNETKANLEIPFVDDVEFLSPKGEGESQQTSAPTPAPQPVETNELPF